MACNLYRSTMIVIRRVTKCYSLTKFDDVFLISIYGIPRPMLDIGDMGTDVILKHLS